jgi:hypothetical protein
LPGSFFAAATRPWTESIGPLGPAINSNGEIAKRLTGAKSVFGLYES